MTVFFLLQTSYSTEPHFWREEESVCFITMVSDTNKMSFVDGRKKEAEMTSTGFASSYCPCVAV